MSNQDGILPPSRPPDLHTARRILAVQPHYDDNDLGAGGTLTALADAGAEVIYLTITDDLVGVVDTALSDQAAAQQLKNEQRKAGEITGVRQQHWLGCPDAGAYDYFAMRRQVIRLVRLLRPDFLFTCDPWLPYEAHRDHIQTGLAVAEASYLHAMPRLKVDPETDRTYEPYSIQGVAFYFTHQPNTRFNVTSVYARKLQAVRCYQAQFTTPDMEALLNYLQRQERSNPEGEPAAYHEALKVLRPEQLHIRTTSWRE